MSRAGAALALVLAVLSRPAGAQRFAAGVEAAGIGSDPVFAGAGPVLAVAVGRELTFAGRALVGGRAGDVAGRGELVLEFRLLGRQNRRPVPYLALGIAGVTGPRGGGYLLGSAGLDLAGPGGGRWLLEAGVGGGIRAGVGYRVFIGSRKRRTAARRDRSRP